MLEIVDLVYNYKNGEIYNFSMDVKAGEIVAILGKSGSGKSTLLDLIAGFILPVKGTIMYAKQNLESLDVEKRPISILFQNHNLFEHLSVEKNILLGVSEKKQNVKEILKEVGLEGYEDKIASKLSGGEQQRVALSRVLLRDKPILLLDEPFTGLDETTHHQMLDLVKKITIDKKLHTIFVTHNRSDCDMIADKVYEVQNHQLCRV